ncbi:MAG TPA: hypothetical protein VIP09_15535 [Dehalococcoidia bacterium]
MDWGMMALSNVTLEAKECDFQIRQPTEADYREGIDLDRDRAVPALTLVLEAWNERCSTHFALLDRLNDLAKHVMMERPWTMSGFYAISKRSTVKSIVKQMEDGYAKVLQVHKETEQVLRTGGGTA